MSFNPSRLDVARRRRGLAKGTLAEQAGISTRILTAYERGAKIPRQPTIQTLAKVLDFPETFFFGPDLDEPPIAGASFRALSTLAARELNQTMAAATIALALSDWIGKRFRLPDANIPQYESLDPETAAMAVRSDWGLGERAIKNLVHLLESQGVRVYSLAEDCVTIDAFAFWRGQSPYIFLNTMKSAERGRFDAAHELGHLVLHWRGGSRRRDHEREADTFASAFLMPRGSVLADAPRSSQLNDIVIAKRRWRVSAAALARRMFDLDLLSEWQYRMIFIDIGKRGYRKNEPNSIQVEQSQVLTKVLRRMRDEGVTLGEIANMLSLRSADLSAVMFGLVLTSMDGAKHVRADTAAPRPQLRIL